MSYIKYFSVPKSELEQATMLCRKYNAIINPTQDPDREDSSCFSVKIDGPRGSFQKFVFFLQQSAPNTIITKRPKIQGSLGKKTPIVSFGEELSDEEIIKRQSRGSIIRKPQQKEPARQKESVSEIPQPSQQPVTDHVIIPVSQQPQQIQEPEIISVPEQRQLNQESALSRFKKMWAEDEDMADFLSNAIQRGEELAIRLKLNRMKFTKSEQNELVSHLKNKFKF